MPIFKFIRPDFQIIIFFIECRNLSSRENLSLLPKAWSNSKTRLPSSSHLRVVPRASNFPRLLLFEKMHQPRRKTFDPVARLSPWNFEGEVGRKKNNSWRLTVTDRGGNWFTGVFLPGKIPPRRDTTLRWPGRGMRLIRPPRVLLPRKITAARPPPLILEITFPGIPLYSSRWLPGIFLAVSGRGIPFAIYLVDRGWMDAMDDPWEVGFWRVRQR